jgi:hypothetical protein
MARHEEPIRAHRPKHFADERRSRARQAPTQERRQGAAAQLAAVHRTLRHGPVLQLEAGGAAAGGRATGAAGANRTGLPDRLKSGVEALSGVALDDVRVYYNSARPAELQALAYTQGTDIHVAPGQERHLPHEAWHVVQQAQGRVKPTMQLKDGVPVNDDAGLEHEADVMGERARTAEPVAKTAASAPATHASLVQRERVGIEFETGQGIKHDQDQDEFDDGRLNDGQDPPHLEFVTGPEILSDEAEKGGGARELAAEVARKKALSKAGLVQRMIGFAVQLGKDKAAKKAAKAEKAAAKAEKKAEDAEAWKLARASSEKEANKLRAAAEKESVGKARKDFKIDARKAHILNRHMYKPEGEQDNFPEKTKFPKKWKEDRILAEVAKLCIDDSVAVVEGRHGLYKRGMQGGIELEVYFYPRDPDNPDAPLRVSTAYPYDPDYGVQDD